MRGKRCAGLKLLLLPAALVGAGIAAAKDAPPLPTPNPGLSPTIFVLDASKSMNERIDKTTELDAARTELGRAVTDYADRLSFGLVAFGHRKTSNCADSEVLARPGDLTPKTQAKLFGKIKAKGQAPIAAALSEAAKAARGPDAKLDVVLVADSSDTCGADICATATELKQKAKGLRINVVGLKANAEELEPLSCAATATGGKFIAATNESEFQEGLALVLDGIANPAPSPTQVVTVPTPSPEAGNAPPQVPGQTAMKKSSPGAPPHAGETAVYKSAPAPTPPQPQRPVPVTFRALVTEGGPQLQNGLTWRVYAAKASADGRFKLLSTHHEAAPTARLLPGEYLVNAAYGLSNLTRKIQVESGKSSEEKFVLNTGGLKLAAVLADGEPCPESSVHFDILSDEEDQLGKRRTILADAPTGIVIRLNAGAYRVSSLYGNANANIGADVTVEPGKITEATFKHTGAKTTFKLVQSPGGEALADTKWTILTSAGDVVKTNAGALPSYILAAGSYAVVADHNGLSYTRKFSIEPGQPKQVEVVIADGPASPDALKALLDPPEPPPPSSGATLAGDGGGSTAAFSGSLSADPNQPLINPGALLRPSTR
jgi:hypothetical protein